MAPAYHLRPNKAVDRFALMDAIKRLAKMGNNDMRRYTYYGLGGPYLEDFRLLYDMYPEIRMVSIEEDEETVKRQEFHLPCSRLRLEKSSMSTFITNYNPDGEKSVFWLDYTELEKDCFADFQSLLGAVANGSMIKITLRAEISDFREKSGVLNKDGSEFRNTFHDVMPGNVTAPPGHSGEFAALLQNMVQIAAQQALPAAAECGKFVPVSSFYYTDGTGMFTLTGIVCGNGEEDKLREAFADWEFANLDWGPPMQINMPALSTKERLRLQPLLPTETPEKTLLEELGYSLGQNTKNALKQYADFHRHAPYFLKGIP